MGPFDVIFLRVEVEGLGFEAVRYSLEILRKTAVSTS